MKLADRIPPVPDTPSDTPSELTRAALAALKPADRNIHLYERRLDELNAEKVEQKSRIAALEQVLLNDRPYEVELEKLRGKYDEAMSQHCLTTLIAGLGALGMGVCDKKDSSEAYWFWVAVTAVGVFLGIASKPLGFIVRKWTGRQRR